MRYPAGMDVSIVVLVIGGSLALLWLVLADRVDFEPFLAGVNPLVVVAALPALLIGGLEILKRGAGLAIWPACEAPARFVLVAGAASVFAIPLVLVDWWTGLGELANVPLPAALLFYPAIALLAETVFHILPLALCVWLLGMVARNSASACPIWPMLILVALIEPAYQAMGRFGAEGWSPAAVLVAVHVYLFNLAQFWVFVRSGFLAMYAFRLVYYFWWHVAWGTLRLEL